MFNLPEKTVLGNLHIETVFQFYDIPRLFTCVNNAGNRYLVISLFDDYETFEWLYLPISSGRLSSLIEKRISLKNAFLSPEDGYIYSVVSDFNGKSELKYIFPEQIDHGDLPEDTVFLETESKVSFGLGAIDADIAAMNTNRETFNLHFYPWDTQLPEMDIKELGSILTSFQDLTSALGQYCKGDVTLKGAIPADIIEATKFRAAQIFEGSFGIQLKSKSTSDLFHSSLASDVLLELSNLIESRDNEDNISNKLHQLQGRVASKYRIFLREISKLGSPMILHWGSPNRDRGRKVSLSKQEIRNAFDVVSKIEIDMSDSVVFKVELLGLDVKTKRYRVKNIADNVDYNGRIADGSLEGVRNSKINGIYNVTLKKVIETNFSSGSEYTKWILVNLESIDS